MHFDADVARRDGGAAGARAGTGRGSVVAVVVVVGARAAGVRGRAGEEVELGVEGVGGMWGAVLVDFVDGGRSGTGAGSESGA